MSKKLVWLDNLLLFEQLSTLKKSDDGRGIWCPIRKKWLILTPEETVRQALISFLHHQLNVGLGRITVEKNFSFPGRMRFDLMVTDRRGHPQILCECKSPEMNFQMKHLWQMEQYNRRLNALLILWTNGHSGWLYDVKKQEFLKNINQHHLHNL